GDRAVGLVQFEHDRHGLKGLVDDLDRVEVADQAAIEFLIHDAGRPEDGGFDIGAAGEQDHEQGEQGDQHERVADDARGKPQLFAVDDAAIRGVANQAFVEADALHDVVAGVDAGGAVDAFQLRAVADVDAGRTDFD